MKHCCDELASRLGKGDSYPKPAYISVEDWSRNGEHPWWYPGADGPGYYYIHKLDQMINVPTPMGMVAVHALEYRRMGICPHCGDKKSRPVGRPPSRKRMESIHLSLYPEQIKYLEEIGEGSISKGARIAIEAQMKG